MAQQTVSLGSVANDGTGESLRSGGIKINANFTELYAAIAIPRIVNANASSSLPGALTGTTIQVAGVDNSPNYLLMEAFGNGVADILFRRAKGTMAAPTAVILNDALGGSGALGHDGTVFGASSTTASAITYNAAENWSATAHGTYVSSYVTKKTTTTLTEQMRLEDTGALWIAKGVAIPAGGTAGVGLKFSTTTNLGIFFGSGAPTLSAAQGSLYMRTDGSSTTTRMYVNTNGTTGWTNVTTAT